MKNSGNIPYTTITSSKKRGYKYSFFLYSTIPLCLHEHLDISFL